MAVTLRVLIIEDSEDDAALLVRHLRQGGYDVSFERVDEPAALEAAWNKPSWDLVISDFSMPHFSGTEALRFLRARGADVPFVFVSGTMGEETAVAALQDGAQDYLMKGNLRRLVPAVERALRESGERRQRKQLEQQVQQLQKFEAIGRLAGGIAHDFNNVIGAILDRAEMGCEEDEPGTASYQRFQQIRDQAQWAGRLTSQLLTFARRQVLQPEKIDLNQLIEAEAAILGTMIGKQTEIRAVARARLPVALADSSQIGQVLLNLCLNARDAMPGGGHITIETTNVELDDEFCRLHADARPGSYVQLSVADTGIGMDASMLERIFEPFFTTKEAGRGTGLGLATVYGVVKQHGGFIRVESQPGKGSTFRLFLPTIADAAVSNAANPDPQSRPGTETILLADDNEGIRAAAREMLESLGYRVLLAVNGKEAVRVYRENAERIELVVLDVKMPALNGPEAYAQICKLRPDVPVIFTTGLSADLARFDSGQSKSVPVLQKPYRLRTLSHTVRGALDRRPPA